MTPAEREAPTLPAPPHDSCDVVIKSCRCCGREFTARGWLLLPNPRPWPFDDEVLHLRDCFCGSTLAI